ncbi:MAG: DUF4846 domain-containing protein [Cytophagaceae bacterium]|nr:DUF4846 domain-containing protein [Cytophagaceae bacterium]
MKLNICLVFFTVVFSLTSCNKTETATAKLFGFTGLSSLHPPENIIDTSGKTIASRIKCPQGFTRKVYPEKSFGSFLFNFPLKPHGSKVYYFNGEEKSNSEVYIAVLDIDVGEKYLQQCADAVIRLRAEYLYKRKLYDNIHFNFTNGFRFDYKKWAEGNRIKVSGNNTSWYAAKALDYSYATFREYMNFVFLYAGTLSLSKELKSVPTDSMQAGDVFIHGGSPGHAVIITDVAIEKSTGNKIMTIAQSYMPAQNIHVLVNENDAQLSPWYDLSKTDKLYSPEWTFEKTELKRFRD